MTFSSPHPKPAQGAGAAKARFRNQKCPICKGRLEPLREEDHMGLTVTTRCVKCHTPSLVG